MTASIGCTGYSKCKDLGEIAVGTFHEHFNNSEFEAIADDAHPELFTETTREEIIELLSMVRSRFGRVNRSDQSNWNVQINRGVTNVTLSYQTSFQTGPGTESFGFLVESGKARMLHYGIEGTQLQGE